ncbi:VIT1/CCC1 transporter family protein [Pseudooceanicola onchidii]|uniref:VIT1/CCC1 transporter family protein n=1 Tax=Pseudooceanicola onchidii TaxID=2562279 RepID=UPI0010AAC409|nr:VIT1/CCC1 transporter family protein [Pseudooceanicola onchidii]
MTDQPEPTSRRARTQDFLKQIVFGGNDGIVTTFAIVAGFAGAQADGVAQIGGLAVLVFGLANLFADAVSMGMGEILSGRAQHDLYRSRLGALLAAIRATPAAEAAPLTRHLARRGLPEPDAEQVSAILSRHPEILAELRMSLDHGMQDPAGDRPILNGLFTFGSFVIFGAVPLFPYIVAGPSGGTLTASVVATFGALTALGLLRYSVTEQGLRRAVGETVLVGAICAVVAYAVGWIVGG